MGMKPLNKSKMGNVNTGASSYGSGPYRNWIDESNCVRLYRNASRSVLFYFDRLRRSAPIGQEMFSIAQAMMSAQPGPLQNTVAYSSNPQGKTK
jgi:hypothetical protein